ncbi:MAG: SOS response-associated peptidase [Calditrichaeota bacterium]|nr:MAG: SOS response-associated peptidase [Calditrichota bacterium]
MCFYTKQTHDAVQIQNRFKATPEKGAEKALAPREAINGFTYPPVPALIDEAPNRIRALHWGLIPHWAKDTAIRQYTLNAKIETLTEKPSFRDCVNNRCGIIADGFFEWQWLDVAGKRKQKYLITLPDNGLFAFAGIWSRWSDPQDGRVWHTCSIITTEATGLMREIHNRKKRMPVILTPDNEQAWLNGAPLADFARPDVALEARPV